MMRHTVCFLVTAFAVPAHAQRSWICTYPGIINPNSPVIDRYTIQGGEILVQQLNARFRILKDDDHAIIGSWIPPIDPTARANYMADVFMVLIDKRTRHFRFVHLGTAPGDSSIAEGSCLPDR